METKTGGKAEQASGNDCLMCRIVSGSGVVGIAAYIFAQSKKRGRNEGLAIQLIAAGVFGIGLARLFNLYPFGRNK